MGAFFLKQVISGSTSAKSQSTEEPPPPLRAHNVVILQLIYVTEISHIGPNFMYTLYYLMYMYTLVGTSSSMLDSGKENLSVTLLPER